MFLTKQRRHPRDPSKFPTTQLFLLALVRIAEPIALTSIFPYAWKLVLNFHVGAKSDASFYAGLLISAFALAESLTGMYWGGLSDRIGRKPVLLLGCAGTMLSLIIVGFSTNFWIALFGRALGGLLNGNIGVIQTMVGELVTKPEHEPKAYSVMPFVWSIGTIVGPSIGGYFANPTESYPDMFDEDGIFGTFPYLLPNVICALLMCLSILMGYFFLEETHPDLQPWSLSQEVDEDAAATRPLIATAGAVNNAAADIGNDSYGTFNEVNIQEDESWKVTADGSRLPSISEKPQEPTHAFTRKVIMLTLALGIFSYHSMTYDHLLPIFFQDERSDDLSATTLLKGAFAGGLGMSTQQVGLIMSVNGVIALFIQAIIFPWMASLLGVWRVFILVTAGHPIAYFIVPYLAFLPAEWLYTGIYACLAVRNFLTILAYPVILILLKEAAPAKSHLGKINGLAASVGAASRTVASPVAGLLYGVGMQIQFTALAWWASGIVAMVGGVQVFFIDRTKNKTAHVKGVAPCRFLPEEGRKDRVVHILVEDSERVEEV